MGEGKITIDEKSILYGIIIIILLLLVLNISGVIDINLGKSRSSVSGSYSNIPEKCRPPAGEDVNSWKEHLGHHTETQDCLQYFK